MNHKNQMRYVRRFVSRVSNCVVSTVNLCCSTWCNRVNIHLLNIHCLELSLFRMLIHFRLPPSLAFFQASLLRLLVIIWTSGNDRFSVKVWCLSHNDPTPPHPSPTHPSPLLLTPPSFWPFQKLNLLFSGAAVDPLHLSHYFVHVQLYGHDM